MINSTRDVRNEKKKKKTIINAHHRLRMRESKIREAQKFREQIYAKIPVRLQIPIERVIDAERKLLQCVILGFSGDGRHIVTHSKGQSGCHHCIQFWKFDMGHTKSRLVREVPVLRERDGSPLHAVKQRNARIVVNFAHSADERVYFFNFQILRRDVEDGCRPEQDGYFCFFPNPIFLANDSGSSFLNDCDDDEEEKRCFPFVLFGRDPEGDEYSDDACMMTTEAARILVKGRVYESNAIVPYCSAWSGLVRSYDDDEPEKMLSYSVFLNLGDGIMEAVYKPLKNSRRADPYSSGLWTTKYCAKRSIFDNAATSSSLLRKIENESFACRDYELFPLKFFGDTLVGRMHCVMENLSEQTKMIVITYAIKTRVSAQKNFLSEREKLVEDFALDILNVSQMTVPISTPIGSVASSIGVKTNMSIRARLKIYKLLLNAATSEAIELRRSSGLSRMHSKSKFRNSSEGDNAAMIYKNKSVNAIIHDTFPFCLLGYGVVVSERRNSIITSV
jgi:hypothetical protein